jgi:uncharacterized repeat protein (TIGR01451 family)
MSGPRGFRRGHRRRFWFLATTVVVVAAFGIFFVAASGAVLTGSPSSFESSDGNMTLDTSGNTDWNCFQGANGFATLSSGTPAGCKVKTGAMQLTADGGGEITWVDGQKFDTQCPALKIGSVPNKDDFTNVASYGEINSSTHDAFFYGAAIRATANGDSSGDVEFNQASGNGTTSAGCRTAGDLLLGYDFTNGGTTLDFHVLTWIDSANPNLNGNSGTCFVNQDSLPCWGAKELTPVTTEGSTNQSAIAAADNGLSGADLVAQQFAEFGVNLTQALGLTASCRAFPQLIWESRSSGSSFTSNPEDIEIEHKEIDTCAKPTIATQASVTGKGVVGTDSTSDSATVSGGNNPTGTIQFSITAPDNTTTNVGGPVTVNGDGSYPAPSSVPLTEVGTYTWHASYSGDSHNDSSADDGTNESVTSIKASPGIATQASVSGKGVVGTDSTSDSATISGGDNPGGTIQFSITAPDKTTTDVGGPVTVNGDGSYPAPSSVPLTEVGTYTWSASYSGDSLNNGKIDDGTNESVASIKASPGIATQASVTGNGVVGTDSTSDSATISGGDNPGGTIQFSITAPDSTTTNVGGPVTVNGDGSYPAPSSVPLTEVGTYTWSASYSGDSLNNGKVDDGTNESVTSTKASPSVTTVADPIIVGVGSGASTEVSDTATFTNGFQLDGDSVSFTLYSDQSCQSATSVAGTALISNNQATFTGNASSLPAGTYYWGVAFAGDANNDSVSECGGHEGVQNEVLTIGRASPTISTTLSRSAGNDGAIVHDSATLSHATPDAGGTVTYTVYSDSACTTKFADGGTVDVTNGSVPNSNNVTFNQPGTYYWQASYSGDVNNKATVSACTDEKLVIAPVIDLSVTKVGSPATQTLGTGNITWTIVVKNNGPDAATGVKISDPLPAGNTFVSVSTSKGSCTGGAVISCTIGNMAAGESVTITLVTTPTTAGNQVNTVTVTGNETESNTSNNTATATVQVTPQTFPPPVVYCVAVSKVTPNQLFVGRKTTLTIHVSQHGKAKAGVHVLIKGPHYLKRTKASNAKGVIKQTVKMKKAGALIFSPIASKRCNTKRIGVTGVFTPPVTG